MVSQWLKSAALLSGFQVRRSVADDRVRALLALLHPMETALPLIRFGGEGDGGYLVPDDLDGLVACFSPGVDVTATFEAAMIARGIPCFLADASVAEAPLDDPLIDFEPSFLGAYIDRQVITLDAWVAAKAPFGKGDLILQMDIEGHEWAVLLSASEATLARFRIIVIEFHGLGRSFDPLVAMMLEACLGRLGQLFHVVHAHPNNFQPFVRKGDLAIPDLLEVTLLRRDRAEVLGPVRQFPHPLDAANFADLPDPPLPLALRGA